MSNEIMTLLKNSVASVATGVDDDTRAVAGSSGNKRISLEGGVFRKYVNGKQVATVQDRDMDIILVKMAHNPSRTFYTGSYQKGVKVSPLCWSTDAKTPDASVKTPQASACEKCPHSVKGSGQGGIGTACRISWRTAVVLPQMPDGDVMQLVIPGASVWGPEEAGKWRFRPYVQMLAANNVSAGRVITKMQFDMNSSSPRLWFSPVAPVNADEVELLANQARSEAAERAVKLTVFQQDGGDAPVEAEVEVEAPPVPEPVLRESKKTTEAPTDVSDVVRKWSKK
jgi:hypothetical protein